MPVCSAEFAILRNQGESELNIFMIFGGGADGESKK